MMKRWIAVMTVVLLLAGCGATQQTVQRRNEVIGQQVVQGNFAEAKQISDIEVWKDDPGKIVLLYVNFPPGSDNVINVQCKGVPASSTESLEPNIGDPWGHVDTWRVPVDGYDVATKEMAGRDGTYGDPVHFRQCLTVDGTYIDVPAMGVPYVVSSVPYTFKPSTVKRDFEAEARLLKAEEIIRRGGCVNGETLVEQPCAEQPAQPATPQPSASVLP